MQLLALLPASVTRMPVAIFIGTFRTFGGRVETDETRLNELIADMAATASPRWAWVGVSRGAARDAGHGFAHGTGWLTQPGAVLV